MQKKSGSGRKRILGKFTLVEGQSGLAEAGAEDFLKQRRQLFAENRRRILKKRPFTLQEVQALNDSLDYALGKKKREEYLRKLDSGEILVDDIFGKDYVVYPDGFLDKREISRLK